MTQPPVIEQHTHISASVVAVVVFLLVALVGGVMYGLERQKRLAAERDAEARVLREHGLLVETQATAAELDAQLQGMHAGFQQLRATLDEVRAKAPETRVVEVTHVVTKTVTVPGPAGACALSYGDAARIEVGEVHLETKLGNEIVTGVASAWRMNPKEKLFEAPFESVASRTARDRQSGQDSLGWGIGPHVQMNNGIGVGVVVGTPIVDVFGFKLEATGALAFGNGFSGALSALIRR